MNDIGLGLRRNRAQFFLLVLVNAFVGAMVGLERSIFPSLAKEEFGVEVATGVLSFIVVFGFVKAIANYYAGSLSNKYGRKRLLLVGWLFAIPVPLLLMWAPSWNWVILANVFLGINQGLAWSSTVIMKIDLVGPQNRGLAMGINEFAGYIAVAIAAYLSAEIAHTYGLKPYPFYLGLFVTALGLIITLLFVRDTQQHAALEAEESLLDRQTNVFTQTSFTDRNLSSVTQAGMVNNLNDGMIWGLLPMYMLAIGFDLNHIAWATGVYPAVWGLGQLVTGKWSDHVSRKKLLVAGMLVQALAIAFLSYSEKLGWIITAAAVLGLGTAMVYPTFLASIADHTHPLDRAKSIGVFRLWRDSGYAFGAILSGLIAHQYGIPTAIQTVAVLTFLSAAVIQLRMES